MGLLAGVERCGVVAADLDRAGALGSHAVIVAREAHLGGLEAVFEIGAHRGDEHDHHVFLGGADADLGRDAYLERTDVERRSRLVGRDEAFVELDDHADHLAELLYGHGLHRDALGAADEALGVLLHAEHAHLAVGAAEGLQALERFLAVVQTACRDVQGNVFGVADHDVAPFAVFVRAAHVIVCLDISERQFVPFKIRCFHLFGIWFKLVVLYVRRRPCT